MLTVWKFPLTADGRRSELRMPRGAQILCVAEQDGNVCLWALCDPTQPPTSRDVLLVCTGSPEIPAAGCVYIGTVLLEGGSLVLHAFELPRDRG